MAMTNEQKAARYDQLLAEYDKKAREVSLLKSKFDLTREDNIKIENLKNEMDRIQRTAANLGSL